MNFPPIRERPRGGLCRPCRLSYIRMMLFRSAVVRSSLAPALFFPLIFACSSTAPTDSGAGGQPGTGGGLLGSGGFGATTASGGTVSSGGSETGGATSTGGLSGTGGLPGSGAAGGDVGSGGASTGGSAAGGSSGSGGDLTSGGAPGGGGAAGSGGTGGSGTGGSGGGGGAALCPADATFCSGFEDQDLPEGAVFRLNGDPATPWTTYFEVDATVHNSGASSLRVKSITEASGAYKMLAVPSGGSAFWARFYLRSDSDLGVNDHNVFAQASGSDDPNDGSSIEFAEDVGIAFNSSDAVAWPDGYGRIGGNTNPYTLPANTWHCVELSFDGAARVQKVYVGGNELINAEGYPAAAKTFAVFKFGYNALHGTARQLWYDDVAVGPTRIGCP